MSVLSYTSAQTIGKVTDEQNHPLAFANIVVMSLPDSATRQIRAYLKERQLQL